MYAIYPILLLLLLTPSLSKGQVLSTEETFARAEEGSLPSDFHMSYVHKDGDSYLIQWTKEEVDLPFDVLLWSDSLTTPIPFEMGEHEIESYNGQIISPNLGTTIGRLHKYANHTEIIISSEPTGNVFIGKQKDQEVQYASEQPYISKRTNHTSCAPSLPKAAPPGIEMRSAGPSTCKKVYFSITADFDLYSQFGRNPARVVSYIHGVLSVVQAIYRLEEIQIGVSEIVIHTAEDGFRHFTALDDLNIFRFIRRSFDGDIALCFSGYKDQTGFAPLGGHAFLSSLCRRSTAYAYVNVDGAYNQFPNFSWDVFGTAHEMGHVLGSEHTHACAWGPHGNTPLDNCAPPEGACSPGPPPTSGTIMSYCHLPGQPGVSFVNGFGPEPGERIRQKIANASCLSDYIPNDPVARTPGNVKANMECHDGTYTHYYFDNNTSTESDDVLLMSLDLAGQDIGHVYDGSLVIEMTYTSQTGRGTAVKITAPHVPTGEGFYAAHRYWKIQPQRQPSRNVTLRIPVHLTDLQDLDNSVDQRLTINDLTPFHINQPGDPNPLSNHRNVTSSRIQKYHHGTYPTTTTYQTVNISGQNHISYKTNKLESGGLGAIEAAALPAELLSFEGERADDKVVLTWTTGVESALDKYEILRSANGLDFTSIGQVDPLGSDTEYRFIDYESNGVAFYYKLRILDLDGSKASSQTIYIEGNSTELITEPELLDHIARNGNIRVRLPTNQTSYSIVWRDLNGRELSSENVNVQGTVDLSPPTSSYSGIAILQVIKSPQENYSWKVLLP